jgi:uncharacterized protein (TIGR02099 family)
MVKKSLIWVYRATLTLLWLTIIILTCSVLLLRYVVLPKVDDYKDQIAQRASEIAGQKITIGEIDASWDGLNPHFALFNVELHDAQDRPALTLNHVETSVSWLSIPLLEPRLSTITIHQPELTIRREADGVVYIAGISMGGPSRPEFPNWLLKQARIDVVDATVLWQDDLRKAPPLTLNKLNLQVISPAWESIIGHHRFGLRATPSAGSSYPIDIRGSVYGRDVSKPKRWNGTVYGRLEGTDIAAWRNWIDYPIDLREGFGAAQFWLDFDRGKPQKVTTDVLLNNVVTRISRNSPEARLNNLSGRLAWLLHKDGQEFKAERIKIDTAGGLNMQNGNATFRERKIDGKELIEGTLKLDEIRLQSLNTLAAYLPIPKNTLDNINQIAPVGLLSTLEASWKGDTASLQKYTIRSQFSGLGMQAYEQFPGFSNLKGTIDADESNGTLTINAQNAEIDLAKVMRWPIPADKLSGQVRWRKSGSKTDIRFSNIAVANAHLTGTVNGSYQINGVKGGYIDLSGRFPQADGKFAHYYYPKVLGESTLHWLDSSILGGRGEDVTLQIRGNLQDFPFIANKNGLFKVTAKIRDGILDYATGWPRIDGLDLDMLFEGVRMELSATGGYLLGNQIVRGKVVIPDLHAQQPILEVNADGQGPVAEGIKYVNNSPLVDTLGGFSRDLRTAGNGKLHLELRIPLHDTHSTKVKGSYTTTNAAIASQSIPDLTRLTGKVDFTESGVSAQNVTAWAYGGPVAFNLNTGKDGNTQIAARGRVTDAGLQQAFGPGLADRLGGMTDWYADIGVHKTGVDLLLRSTLLGMASTLPPPMGKTATERMTLRLEKKQTSADQDTITVSLENLLNAKLLRTNHNGTMQIERGEIGVHAQAELPTTPGINIRGSMESLDLDEWRNLFEKSTSTATPTTASTKSDSFPVNKVDVDINQLDVFDRRINNLKLNAKSISEGWQMTIQSKEMAGDAQWSRIGNGKITARLKYLIAPTAVPGTAELRTQGQFKQQAQQYPALDVIAENFEMGPKKLGRLELLASEQDDDWSIEKLKLITPESTLTAEGEWHNWKRNPNTRINLSWDINDIGKTLERYGYPNTIKGGDADLSGQLKWPGSPHEFDIPGLSGALQLDARKGQILKIQPGVGRLFGVLSLQSLPRRLTLDFRDVFSSGFTFDKISASVRIDKGVMRSDDFKMEGPVALVEMKGETDLKKETQHLFVRVTPYISDSLSIAALAGGPLAGAAAFIAQKLLKDPINKMAADDYEITGTWDNPQEVKSADKKPAAPVSPLGK